MTPPIAATATDTTGSRTIRKGGRRSIQRTQGTSEAKETARIRGSFLARADKYKDYDYNARVCETDLKTTVGKLLATKPYEKVEIPGVEGSSVSRNDAVEILTTDLGAYSNNPHETEARADLLEDILESNAGFAHEGARTIADAAKASLVTIPEGLVTKRAAIEILSTDLAAYQDDKAATRERINILEGILNEGETSAPAKVLEIAEEILAGAKAKLPENRIQALTKEIPELEELLRFVSSGDDFISDIVDTNAIEERISEANKELIGLYKGMMEAQDYDNLPRIKTSFLAKLVA